MSSPSLQAETSPPGVSTRLAPIFVVGCPRSGTTMLAGLLNESPWGGGFETHFIPKYWRKLARYGDLSERSNCTRLVRDILSERPVMQWKLELDPDEFFSSLERFDYTHIVDRLCCLHTTRSGLDSWSEKTPDYIFELELMHQLFPGSKFVYIVRDGRDTALSLMERSWGPANAYACATYWKRCNETRQVAVGLHEAGLLHPVRYEDLLDKPVETLSGLVSFLGLDWSEEQLERVTGAIRSSNHTKWKSRMSAKEIRIFENVAADTLRRFGYETSHEEAPVSAPSRFLYRLHDRCKHAWNVFEMNVIDTVKIRFFGKEPFGE